MTQMQRIVTFIDYDYWDEVQAMTAEEFRQHGDDSDWSEWVWHDAPSKREAIARHFDAHFVWENDPDFEVFDHSKNPAGPYQISAYCKSMDRRVNLFRWVWSAVTGIEKAQNDAIERGIADDFTDYKAERI